MCFNQRGDISTLNGSSLKLVDKFNYLRSSVSSTETDINMWQAKAKAWASIDRLSVIWKSDLTDKIKRSFFQAAAVLILLYGCTTLTLTKCAEHCWRSRDKLISDVLLWTPSHRQAKAGRPARTYIQQLCSNMRCSPEDLPEAMDDRERWQERVRDICADSMTWWWWYSYCNRVFMLFGNKLYLMISILTVKCLTWKENILRKLIFSKKLYGV